jgi:hypothetical protein
LKTLLSGQHQQEDEGNKVFIIFYYKLELWRIVVFRENESCHQNATCDGCARGTHAIKEGLLVQAKMYGKT